MSVMSHFTEKITYVKVKGHSDNEGNARADKLANIAMDNIEKESVK
jgi:ribonuclease HI